MAEQMLVAARKRPAPEEKGAAVTELEEEVAKALFDIEASAGRAGSCFELIWRRTAPWRSARAPVSGPGAATGCQTRAQRAHVHAPCSLVRALEGLAGRRARVP